MSEFPSTPKSLACAQLSNTAARSQVQAAHSFTQENHLLGSIAAAQVAQSTNVQVNLITFGFKSSSYQS